MYRPARSVDLRPKRVSVVSTYPPTRCGIGRFTHSLLRAWTGCAPATELSVARILDPTIPTGGDGREVDLLFDPASAVARRAAAQHLSHLDAVIVQHEFGIFGPDDGIGVVDLVTRIKAPVMTAVHTVRSEPSERQRAIIEELSRLGSLIVLSDVAREQLLHVHNVDPSNVFVIPHGSAWLPRPAQLPLQRRRLITWGLLGPGKGIERALRAVAELDLDPAVTYDIVGQTHPNVLARHGQSYRRSLESLADALGIADRVNFIDRYVSDDELEQMVGDADLVVVPYDNDEQVCSGVLTDAIAAGKPVVATAFPHARDLARYGCVITAPHDPRAIADAVDRLLGDDDAYDLARQSAVRLAETLRWTEVAGAYQDLVHARAQAVVA